jgi:hypothetical protein
MKNFWWIMPGFSILISCATGDTERDYSVAVMADNSDYEVELLINEFSPKSELLNELGEEADWIELYNNSDHPVEINAFTWSLTDDENEPERYVLPDTIIPVGGHLLIWCDEALSEDGFLHAGFKLKGNGETIYLFKNGELADEITYDDEVKKSCSYGRSQDGSEDWKKFKEPTPGASNSLLEHYAETLH